MSADLSQPLDENCPVCRGSKGFESFGPDRGNCFQCHGTGVVPTSLGKAILDLMRHNAPVLADELECLGAR